MSVHSSHTSLQFNQLKTGYKDLEHFAILAPSRCVTAVASTIQRYKEVRKKFANVAVPIETPKKALLSLKLPALVFRDVKD